MREGTPVAGVVWNGGAGLLLVGTNLALVPIGIAVAGASTYGAWAIAFSAVLLLGQADFGLASGVVRQAAFSRAAGNRQEAQSIVDASFRMFLAMAAGIPVVLAAGLFAYFGQSADRTPARDLAIMLVGAGAGCAVAVLIRFYSAVLQSFGRYDLERSSAVVGQLVRLGVMLLALTGAAPVARLGGLALLAIADVLGLVVTLGISAVIAHANHIVRQRTPYRAARRAAVGPMLRFGWPVFVSSFATLSAMQVPLYVTGGMLGFRESAAVAAATRIYQSSRTVVGWVTAPALPHAARLAAMKDTGGLKALHVRASLGSVALGAAISATLVLTAADLLGVWIGYEYRTFWPVLAAFGAAVVVNSASAPGVVVATGAGRPDVSVPTNLTILALTVVFTILGSVAWGVLGVAVGSLCAVVLVFPWMQVRICKVIGVAPMQAQMSYVLIIGAAAAAGALSLLVAKAASFGALPEVALVAVSTLVGIGLLLHGAWSWMFSRSLREEGRT